MKSIKDIAIEAKVSAGTVDRVIHNRGGVSKNTRERILKIIKANDFTINPVASSLASKKKYTIASIIPQSDNSEFWESPRKGIVNKIKSFKTFGFELDEFYFDQFSVQSYTKTFKTLLKSNPSAVIIAPVFFKETKLLTKQLDERNIPYVFINIEIENMNNISFVGQSSYKGGFLAGKMMQLYKPEKVNVGIVKIRENVSNYNAIEQRISGFFDYFKSENIDFKFVELQLKSINDPILLSKQLSTYLKKHSKINAIYTPSSEAGKIAKYFHKEQLRKFTLIGFDTTEDNIKFLKNGYIDLLIGQQPKKQGADGVSILVDFLIHKITPLKKYYSPIEIIVKENIDLTN